MINAIYKENKTIEEYGILVGDVLLNGNKAIKIEPYHLVRNFVNLKGQVDVFRHIDRFSLNYIGSIVVDDTKEFMENVHPQKKLTKEDLKLLVRNIDSNFLNVKSPVIVYTRKKGRSYKISKISISELKMNFDSIVNSGKPKNFYWLEAPAIEYTKQSWYSMSKRQKRDFEDFLIEVE